MRLQRASLSPHRGRPRLTSGVDLRHDSRPMKLTRLQVSIAVTVTAVAAFGLAYAGARAREYDRAQSAETARDRSAQALALASPSAPKLACGADLACVADKASELVTSAERAGRDDLAEVTRDLRSALVAHDCRAAMAADERIDRLELRPSDGELLAARIALMNELLGACMLVETPGPSANRETGRPLNQGGAAERRPPREPASVHSAGDADVARALAPTGDSSAGAE